MFSILFWAPPLGFLLVPLSPLYILSSYLPLDLSSDALLASLQLYRDWIHDSSFSLKPLCSFFPWYLPPFTAIICFLPLLQPSQRPHLIPAVFLVQYLDIVTTDLLKPLFITTPSDTFLQAVKSMTATGLQLEKYPQAPYPLHIGNFNICQWQRRTGKLTVEEKI